MKLHTVWQHLHDEGHHLSVWDGPQQLKVQSAVPVCVVGGLVRYWPGLLLTCPAGSQPAPFENIGQQLAQCAYSMHHPFQDLEGDTEQQDGSISLWVIYRFVGFQQGYNSSPCHTLGVLDLWRHTEKEMHSQADGDSLWWFTNSGWMLSRPGTLPCLSLEITTLSSVVVKCPELFLSTMAAMERANTCCNVRQAKFLSAPGYCRFFRSWVAMALLLADT